MWPACKNDNYNVAILQVFFRICPDAFSSPGPLFLFSFFLTWAFFSFSFFPHLGLGNQFFESQLGHPSLQNSPVRLVPLDRETLKLSFGDCFSSSL